MAYDQSNEPIAIIGMSCRLPGGVSNPEDLWDLCARGRSAWSEIPRERFDADAFHHANHRNQSTMNVTGGHFLKEDVGLFDAPFFNLTPEAASTMDPQCRLLLEIAYEAFENAGLGLDKIAGTETAVFTGAFYRDYMDGLMRDPETLPVFTMTGNGSTMMSNRISHFYDLRGPSMTVDTGCSTGLVALHQACQSLKTGDSEMALVAAANLILNPDLFVLWSSLGFLSSDGRSYAFDHRACGYGRGEGVAALLLKPLSAAIRDGDPIRALIRQTALNQDGKTQTITSPSQDAQERLIQACYAKAGLDPAETSYVEAHGTGTQAGDVVEAAAISRALAKHHTSPLYVGSVKTNIGHLETTSGLAAIIKVAMAVDKGYIPPSINFEKANAKIPLDDWNLAIPRQLEKWPAGEVRRASVSNFGYGGANAHVIVEAWNPEKSLTVPLNLDALVNWDLLEQPTSSGVSSAGSEDSVLPRKVIDSDATSLNVGVEPARLLSRVFMLSAKQEANLKATADNLYNYLSGVDQADETLLDNLAFTLNERRSRFPWSVGFTASSPQEVMDILKNDLPQPIRSSDSPRVGFVFTGQGAQWYAMGRELIATYPVFGDTIYEADRILESMDCEWSLVDELLKPQEESRVNDVVLSPPMCIAVQIGLVRLLKSWGITPVGVTSHSSGEIAAAYAAGVVTLAEAMAIVFARGNFLAALQSKSHYKGTMIAAGCSRKEAEALIEDAGLSSTVVVACVNSPSSVTISGDQESVAKVEQIVRDKSLFVRPLKVPVAYHSHHMLPVAADYLRALKSVLCETRPFADNSIIYTSPVSGKRVLDASTLGPQHWVDNMVQPVLFVDALRELLVGEGQDQVDILVEVGAHGALAGPIRQSLQLPELSHLNVGYASCLTRGKSAVQTMQTLAATLAAKGCPVDLEAVNFPSPSHLSMSALTPKVLTDLPTYVWNHETRHWYESRINKMHRNRENPKHDLLGSMLLGATPRSPTWRHFIRVADIPWVRDHKVQSDIVYPGAGYISMAIEAMKQVAVRDGTPFTHLELRDVDIKAALVIPETADGVEVVITLQEAESKTLGLKEWSKFSISSVDESGQTWTEHCSGLIAATSQDSTVESTEEPDSSEDLVAIEPDSIFSTFRNVGIYHGDIFRNLNSIELKKGKEESVSVIKIADSAATMPSGVEQPHIVHPTTLDSVIVAAYTSLQGSGHLQNTAMVPRFIKHIQIAAEMASLTAGKEMLAISKTVKKANDGFYASVETRASGSNNLIRVNGLFCKALAMSSAVTDEQESEGPLGVNTLMQTRWAEDASLTSLDAFAEKLKLVPDEEEVNNVRELKQACYFFIREALQIEPQLDESKLAQHHHKYIAWMKEEVANANPRLDQAWSDSTPAQRDELYTRVAADTIDGELVCRIGRNLAGILRREIQPLEVMIQDDLLSRYYQGALRIGRTYQQMQQMMDLVAHKTPGAKILEIGAGTGGCTQYVLDILGGNNGSAPRFSQYDFTDVSGNFLDHAKERFRAWGDLVKYNSLDIESDPSAQGFEEGTYDVVVACQVLHATKNMDNTMRNVHRMLKPGGRLLMVETTHDTWDISLIFGSLPGWWLSEEPERYNSPSLSVPFWQTVLGRTNFSGLDMNIPDSEDPQEHVMNLLVSTALPAESAGSEQAGQVVVVSTQETAANESLALVASLKNQATFGSVEFVSLADIVDSNVEDKICVLVDTASKSILVSPTASEFQAIKKVTASQGLLWISRGGALECTNPASALSTGFLRTLRTEDRTKRYVTLDLEEHEGGLSATDIDAITRVATAAFDPSVPNASVDTEYVSRGAQILVPRVTVDDSAKAKEYTSRIDLETTSDESLKFHDADHPVRLGVASVGMLDSLIFYPDSSVSDPLGPDEVEIQPRAFGLNFRDVMVAMGQLDTSVMGFECSGIVTRLGSNAAVASNLKPGDRVIALLRGHWATRVRADWRGIAVIPNEMTFEVAASVLLVFATAYYSLHTLAQIQEGDTILIHSAAGAVGQAAVMLAQRAGATVFATVGSAKRKELVMSQYGVPAENIFSSRDTSFGDNIRRRTNGRGVDIVLNSLAGELLHETWTCLAPFGRFVEIGKRDFEQNSRLQMAPFVQSVSFFAVDLLNLNRDRPVTLQRVVKAVMDLFYSGQINAVTPITNFPIDQLQQAFRTMQAGKHLGKIVVVPELDAEVQVRLTKGAPRMTLSADASYLVVGGLGGVGRSVCQRLVERGAKNLVLVSRSAQSSKHSEFLEELSSQANVVVRNLDVTNAESLKSTVQELEQQEVPPIRGVIQAAMVLQDSIFELMSPEQYMSAVSAKVEATWNLHRTFRDVDFFVMLSSVVGIVGNPSQSNYAAGGTFQDALAQLRRSRGLSGVSIDLGMVGSVGYVAENEGVEERLARQGLVLLPEDLVLRLVESAIISETDRLSARSQFITGISTDPEAVARNDSPLATDMRFAALRTAAIAASNRSNEGGDNVAAGDKIGQLLHNLNKSESWEEALGRVCEAMTYKLARMFGLGDDDVNPAASMAHYGVDSLVAVELRNWLAMAVQTDISIFEITQAKSINLLAKAASTKSKLIPAALKPT
ncbi:reducing type I polyketide synthase [Stachybotrys elegans]|uniref:Reducing type I polyketide synthase n=1 Tax=Stachybotrys elegans TaxID=80388 RepID=A0A8K0SZE8_9HYPO|nr:reducing type I polyketide synthase [Stachybotrys elegans]